MEIGDTIEEETSAEENPGRSSGNAGTRRKNGKNGGKGRNGKGNGNAAGIKRSTEYNGGTPASDERMRDVDLRRLLSALRDLRDGEFDVRLETSEDPMLADIADAFNGIANRLPGCHSKVCFLPFCCQTEVAPCPSRI